MNTVCPECGKEFDAESSGAACPFCDNDVVVAEAQVENPLEPPDGTVIIFTRSKSGEGVFELPRRGLRPTHIFMIVFFPFWLAGFLALVELVRIWGVFFLLFAVPFWLAGFWLIAIIINSIAEKQFVELKRDRMILKNTRPVFSTETYIPFASIESLSLEMLEITNLFTALKYSGAISEDETGGRKVHIPTCKYDGKRAAFAICVTEREKEWIMAVVREFISQKTGKEF